MCKKIYIVLTKTNTVLSRIIHLYTQSSFTHASIAFDASLSEMYSFGRKKETNPFSGGFVHENPSSAMMSNAKCLIFSCDVTEEQYQLLKREVKHYQSNKHCYKYNFIGLFSVACGKQLKRQNAFFCSQFVATLLERVGLPLNGQPPCLMKPTDLASLSFLNMYYEGNMQHYIKQYSEKRLPCLPTPTIQHIA